MAIRLRVVEVDTGKDSVRYVRVALCAAKTEAQSGDVYLDDGWHYAISQKYWRDYEEIVIVDEDDIRLTERIENENQEE